MATKTKTSGLIKFEIRNRWTGDVQFVAEIETDETAPFGVKVGLALKWAIGNKKDLSSANLSGADLRSADLSSANLSGADLRSAYLSGANLSSAYLSGANLSSADLSGADLSSANLSGADLRSAYLSGANLSSAYLSSANLSGADLRSAYLSGANLSSAYLSGANLSGADLRSAYLRSANLSGANLSSADLSGAENAELAIAQTRILPDGDLIGWKKCQGGVIAKLLIPAAAKRSHAFGRKCRAEYADVLEVIGGEKGLSQHDGATEYSAGQRVTPDKFDENWQEECAPGIHFFITRAEAEAY